jgi:hypothetical protein
MYNFNKVCHYALFSFDLAIIIVLLKYLLILIINQTMKNTINKPVNRYINSVNKPIGFVNNKSTGFFIDFDLLIYKYIYIYLK